MIYLGLSVLAFAAIAFQAWQFGRERERWQDVERSLLDRIQAPEKALLHDMPDIPPSIPYDDDEAFYLAKQESSGDN